MTDTYLPLGCFGKLPCFGDFLGVRVSQPTAVALKELMLEGKREMAAEQSENGYRDSPIENSLRILLGLPGSRELLVGVLRPSHDSHPRNFPFLAFTHVPRRAFGRHYALLPLALAPLWDALDDAWKSLYSVTSKPEFDDAVAAVELPGPGDLKSTRGDYQGRLREEIGAMFGGLDGASPANLTRNLPDFVQAVSKNGNSGLNVMLPVTRDLSESCFDVSVWVDLVNRQFRFKRFEPSVVLDGRPGSNERWVVLRFGVPAVSDYMHFVNPPGAEVFLRPAHATEAAAVEDSNDWKKKTYVDLLGGRL